MMGMRAHLAASGRESRRLLGLRSGVCGRPVPSCGAFEPPERLDTLDMHPQPGRSLGLELELSLPRPRPEPQASPTARRPSGSCRATFAEGRSAWTHACPTPVGPPSSPAAYGRPASGSLAPALALGAAASSVPVLKTRIRTSAHGPAVSHRRVCLKARKAPTSAPGRSRSKVVSDPNKEGTHEGEDAG